MESLSGTKKYLKAGSFYFLGNIFDKAVAFITVPIFTRLLNTSDYGVTSTFLAWITILSVVITLSLGNSIRTAVVDFSDDKDGYMSSIFALGTISAMILTTVVTAVATFVGDSNTVLLVLFCCICSYSYSILASVKWRYMMDLKYIKRTVLQCVPNVVIIILSIVLIVNMDEQKYLGRIYGILVIDSLLSLSFLVYYFLKGRKLFCTKYWKYALIFSIPIIFHSLSTVILSQADRTMITILRSSAETGIYSLAYQFGMVPVVIATTVENVWIPWFTKKMESADKKNINKMVLPYLLVVAIACAVIMLIAPEILKFMSTESYYGAIFMIPPIVLGAYLMFLSSISLDLEYYMKKTKMIATNTMVAAAVNVGLNAVFIPKYGGTAAAYTTAASYLVSFIMHYIVARKLDSELFDLKLYIAPIAFIVFFTCVTSFLIDFALARWSIGGLLSVIFICFGLRCYKKIKLTSASEV